MNELLSQAPRWLRPAETYLTAHWQEVGLIAAMAIACLLLFWRLGTRSRQSDLQSELLLEVEAAPEEFEAALALPLPSPNARPIAPRPAPSVAVLLLKDVAPPPRRDFATLREALEAMKADQAHAGHARKPLRV